MTSGLMMIMKMKGETMPTSFPTKPMSKDEFKFLLWLIKLKNCEPMKIEE